MDRNQGFIYTQWGLMEVGHYGMVRLACYLYLYYDPKFSAYKYEKETPLEHNELESYQNPLEGTHYEDLVVMDVLHELELLQEMELAGE